MRTPNNVVLDFYQNKSNDSYWVDNFLEIKDSNFLFVTKKNTINFVSSDVTINTFNKNNFIVNNYKKLFKYNNDFFNINILNGLVNVNFLRKEMLYTKLKYSRSPAYDSVSGGTAAILAGLVAFLISEKFGFELVDSGDFYYLFMYLVFISFSVLPLLFSSQADKSIVEIFGPGNVITFYNILVLEFIKTCKFLIKKVYFFFKK